MNERETRAAIPRLRQLAVSIPQLSDIFLKDAAELEKSLGPELTPQTAIVVTHEALPSSDCPYHAAITGTSIIGFGETEGEAIAHALEVVKDLEAFRNDIMAVIGKQMSRWIESP
jgi:hypothetical protein